MDAIIAWNSGWTGRETGEAMAFTMCLFLHSRSEHPAVLRAVVRAYIS